jgi:hypothetical protein
MPVDSKTTTSWEHTYTAENGHTMTVSGINGSDFIQVKLYELPEGYGMNESPSHRASITMTCAEWSNLIKLIGIK